jgi:hypothetical protein
LLKLTDSLYLQADFFYLPRAVAKRRDIGHNVSQCALVSKHFRNLYHLSSIGILADLTTRSLPELFELRQLVPVIDTGQCGRSDR